MKNLTRIRLINWHLFENATISCQGTTYFIGVNGAGKSTILDALQFALVGGQRDVRFNQAALSRGKRTLASYVRGELGTEGQRFLRDDATAVVALEFKNSDGSLFVHGAVVDAYRDGRSPDVSYFIVHNLGLDDNWFFKAPAQLFDSRAFRRHLEHYALPAEARAQVFTRLEDYRFHLLNRLGQLSESFPAKIVKGLAFSPLTDIRAFVHNYLLDEDLVDVHTLQEQLETLLHFEALAADVRERIAALDGIEELDQERRANRRRRITNGYLARRARSDAHQTELKARRLELDEARLTLDRTELELEAQQEELKHAQAALVDAQVALQTDAAAARARELQSRISALEGEQAALQARAQQARETLARERTDAQRLQALLAADARAALDAVGDFLHGHRDRFPPPERPDSLQPLVAALPPALEALGQEYAGQGALLDEQTRQLRVENEQLEREVRQLRTGDHMASFEAQAPQAVRLQRLLRAELGIAAGEAIFLCTALQVADESWQDAVEGLLGRNRFTLLVPPEHYAAALALYRDRRHKDGLHGVGLLDSERLLAHARPPDAGSLATEVQSDHPVARAFVDLLLGRYTKCEALEDLREHRTAITRECMLRRNFSSSHLNPHVYRRWFVGARAIPRQIEQREARLDEIGVELNHLEDRKRALRERLALTRDKVRPLLELDYRLTALARLPDLEAELQACQDELAALDLRSAESLRAAVAEYQATVAQRQSAAANLERRSGGLESKIAALAEEAIPQIERAADAALREAQDFFGQESAAEMQADVEKEYARRRERQPLETVLENATRYEGDYQSAEARSRDRMREAKQAYSLKYDFGYDADEDAVRYGGEREKLAGSALPEYEERIAAQRALAEQELVENFIHRLREQIESARQQLAYLNQTLVQLRFGGERYEFISQPAPAQRKVYAMVMDSQSVLGAALSDSDFRQRHQQAWGLLFERLTSGADEALLPELRELQDYRNYLNYDIRIHYPNGDRALLSKISAKKSGGETTTPFYVAMAASFAQAYRLNQPHAADTIRLALFDEAFGKMDTARTASALKFMNEAGLQVLLATPPDKSGALLPYVDAVRTVVRKNNHSFVIEIDRAEMLAQLEQTEPAGDAVPV